MNPQRRNQIILGVLGAVAAVIVVWQVVLPMFSSPTPAATPTQAGAPAKPGQPAAATAAKAAAKPGSNFDSQPLNVDELLANVQSVDFNYIEESKLANARDPMTPLVYKTFEGAQVATGLPGTVTVGKTENILRARQMVLSGIIYNAQSPVAIIENEIVGPGYQFPSGIVVESISEDGVVLRVEDTPIERKLGEQ
jgi:hypothetical protein